MPRVCSFVFTVSRHVLWDCLENLTKFGRIEKKLANKLGPFMVDFP